MKRTKTAHSIGKNRQQAHPLSLSPSLREGTGVGLSSPVHHPHSHRYRQRQRPFSLSLREGLGVGLCCLLSAVFFFLSCSQTSAVREQLQRAEQMMETDSRAAALVLDSIDSSTLRGEDAALYALLKTQADYKSRIRLTSDSLPLIATHFYGTKRKGYRVALSQYYLGCAYGDMQRDLDAIDALLRATTLFPDTMNKYFANSLFELGLLYLKHHMEEKALGCFGRYRNLDICNMDSVNIGYVDYQMGLAASYLQDDLRADSLFLCVINNTHNSNIIRENTYFQLAKLYYYHKHDTEASWSFLSKIDARKRDAGAFLMLEANLLEERQNYESAFKKYQKALQNSTDIYTSCTAYKGLANVASIVGTPDSTRFFVDQYTALLDSIYASSRLKEIAEIQESHVVELHDKELEARHRRFLLWIGLFGIVVLTGAVIAYLLADRRRKAERLRYENALDAIRQKQVEQLAQEEQETPDVAGYTEEPDEESDGLEKPENSLFVTIQRERIALYRQQFAKSEWPAYFHLHRTDIKLEKKMDAKHSEELRRYLKTLFSELFVSMLGSNIEMTKHDLEYCAMVMLGFSTTQMAYCTQASVHSYHCRHGKMKSMLSDEWYQIIYGKVKQ